MNTSPADAIGTLPSIALLALVGIAGHWVLAFAMLLLIVIDLEWRHR